MQRCSSSIQDGFETLGSCLGRSGQCGPTAAAQQFRLFLAEQQGGQLGAERELGGGDFTVRIGLQRLHQILIVTLEQGAQIVTGGALLGGEGSSGREIAAARHQARIAQRHFPFLRADRLAEIRAGGLVHG